MPSIAFNNLDNVMFDLIKRFIFSLEASLSCSIYPWLLTAVGVSTISELVTLQTNL